MNEWAHLEEIVKLVASNLFAKDVQSCGLVCRTWKAAVADSPWRRSPCLMLYHRAKGLWQFHQHTGLFYMNLPGLDKAHICSSKYGWVLMQLSCDRLFFFDPFNNRTINVKLRGEQPWFNTIHFFNRPTSPECFVVGICSDLKDDRLEIGILKRGMSCWEKHEYKSKFRETPSSPVLRGGLLYLVDIQGNVATLDVDGDASWTFYTKCLPFRKLRSKITQHFLFEIKGDEALYAVFLIHDAETVNVFRLSEPGMKWESVKDLGDKMVYLSVGSCFGDTAHFPNMANKIYFPKFHGNDMLCYSLATRKYHSLEGDYSHHDSFGLRRFDVGVAWILPADAAQDWPADVDAQDWPENGDAQSAQDKLEC